MWSVGCIFAEFLAMTALFPGKSEIDQLNRIFKVNFVRNFIISPCIITFHTPGLGHTKRENLARLFGAARRSKNDICRLSRIEFTEKILPLYQRTGNVSVAGTVDVRSKTTIFRRSRFA